MTALTTMQPPSSCTPAPEAPRPAVTGPHVLPPKRPLPQVGHPRPRPARPGQPSPTTRSCHPEARHNLKQHSTPDDGAPKVRVSVAPAVGALLPRRQQPLPPQPVLAEPARAKSQALSPGPTVTAAPLTRKHWDRVQFQTQVTQPEAVTLVERASTPRPPAPAESPGQAAAHLVSACVQVLEGHRSVQALVRRTTPELFDALARRASLAQRLADRVSPATVPQVRSSRAQEPLPGRAEAVVVLEAAGRVRAAAAHLLLRRGRWILTGLEIA